MLGCLGVEAVRCLQWRVSFTVEWSGINGSAYEGRGSVGRRTTKWGE